MMRRGFRVAFTQVRKLSSLQEFKTSVHPHPPPVYTNWDREKVIRYANFVYGLHKQAQEAKTNLELRVDDLTASMGELLSFAAHGDIFYKWFDATITHQFGLDDNGEEYDTSEIFGLITKEKRIIFDKDLKKDKTRPFKTNQFPFTTRLYEILEKEKDPSRRVAPAQFRLYFKLYKQRHDVVHFGNITEAAAKLSRCLDESTAAEPLIDFEKEERHLIDVARLVGAPDSVI